MSWQKARKDAQHWLDTLNLQMSKMKGQTIDLSGQAKKLRGKPQYVAMVIEAAKRKLYARGIIAKIDLPPTAGELLDKDQTAGE